jgi:PAP2 superfamily
MDDVAFIRALRGDGSLDAFFLPITNLGSELGYIALLTVVYLLAPSVGRQLGLWFGVNVALNTLLKFAFNLPRPFFLDSSIGTLAAHLTAGGPGLPSGHAQNAAFVWGYMALRLQKIWIWVLAILVTLLIAFSRMYLGVHFLEDVILGLVLGGFLAFVASRVNVFSVNALTAAGLLIALSGLCTMLGEDYGRVFGLLWAFLCASADFKPPANIGARFAFAIGGLVLVFALYFASSTFLPEEVKRSGVGSLLRYALLTLAVVELYPRLVLGGWSRKPNVVPA